MTEEPADKPLISFTLTRRTVLGLLPFLVAPGGYAIWKSQDTQESTEAVASKTDREAGATWRFNRFRDEQQDADLAKLASKFNELLADHQKLKEDVARRYARRARTAPPTPPVAATPSPAPVNLTPKAPLPSTPAAAAEAVTPKPKDPP